MRVRTSHEKEVQPPRNQVSKLHEIPREEITTIQWVDRYQKPRMEDLFRVLLKSISHRRLCYANSSKHLPLSILNGHQVPAEKKKDKHTPTNSQSNKENKKKTPTRSLKTRVKPSISNRLTPGDPQPISASADRLQFDPDPTKIHWRTLDHIPVRDEDTAPMLI